jgi:hypothetical protein
MWPASPALLSLSGEKNEGLGSIAFAEFMQHMASALLLVMVCLAWCSLQWPGALQQAQRFNMSISKLVQGLGVLLTFQCNLSGLAMPKNAATIIFAN